MATSTDPLAHFSAATRDWFGGSFDGPTPAQAGAWDAIGAGDHALVVAPTGSGKTLAAFLWAVDRLLSAPPPDAALRCRVLYVSPLKALAADVQRNLRAPLTGIRQAAARRGTPAPEVTVGMRTGDTPASERRSFAARPPDVLVTTPESLFLVLTSSARAGLAGVETVVVDEIHALAGTKRGAHLAVSLERLDELLSRPAQRIGLSATVRPVDAVAGFLGGGRTPADGGREVVVVAPPSTKRWDLSVAVPVPDLTDLADAGTPGDDLAGAATSPARQASVWPHVTDRVVDLVAERRSTLVFTNSRRAAERMTARINETWAERQGLAVADPGTTQAAEAPGQSGTASPLPDDVPVLARAHHGSMSRTERTRTESELKAGTLPAVVATSSLELGIDMGAVDLVVQVGAPPSVASGLQRVGRAGHQVGAVSHGVVLPTHRGDLVPAAVVAQRMLAGDIEPLHVVSNPLDVLAQQVVATLALEDRTADDLLALVRRAAPFRALGDATWHGVLDMLAGRYPSEEFAELRPRVVWDRATGRLSARPGAQRLAVTSGGTIPDRGMYGVYLAGDEGGRGGKRVGELDEEMVYESRVGDTFTLGSSTWRIDDITPDRVLVTPAPGLPGRLPFWKGDAPGRPAPLGRAVGEFRREADAALAADPARGRAYLADAGLDPWAADNLAAYLTEQREATGRVPDDRTLVVERFRDELGDWRVVVHSPYGARVHTPWALVVAARLRERLGADVAAMPSDDGIVLRLPGDSPWDLEAVVTDPQVGADDLLVDPADLDAAVRAELGSSVLFAARFREAAARALLLPRRRPDRRAPLWQQRQRAAQLLQVASAHPEFPIMLEAARECLQDDFDVAALRTLLTDVAAGRVGLVEVTTPQPSPFARSLLFGYTAQFLYDGDAPLAERRAAALTLDADLLAELLGEQGATDLADLLDPEAVTRTQDELQALAPDRRARDAEALWDVLRRTGPHPLGDLVARTVPERSADVPGWLTGLERDRRVLRFRRGGVERWAVVDDAGRLRDALGVELPAGLAEQVLDGGPDPLGDLVRRHARTHGPFTAAEVAHRFGLGHAVVAHALAVLVEAGVVVRGALRPEVIGGTGDEFCDVGVLQVLRRRSLAALRAEVEPVEPEALGLFLPRWQEVGTRALRGTDGLLRAVEQLAGAAVPASALETLVLPARVEGYTPALLDQLTTTGEVLWAGHRPPSTAGGGDGTVSLHLAEDAPLTLAAPDEVEPDGPLDTPLHRAVLDHLTGSGGYFLGPLAEVTGHGPDEVLEVLWDLVWSGHVTNDGIGALRERLGSRARAHRSGRPGARARPLRRSRFAGSRPVVPRGGGGRWSALPAREEDATVLAHAVTQVLLDRHGVLTRAMAPAEGVTGRFRDVYRVLSGLEERGAVRRGYFVERLGGAQFALPGAVDRLRADAAERDRLRADPDAPHRTLLLAATDPANPYGAALPWPAAGPDRAAAHRPGRKAGAVVVLVDGALGLYVERGGRTVLTFTDEPELLAAAAATLAGDARADRLGRLTVRVVDGVAALDAVPARGPAVSALLAAGFTVTPQGLRVGR
ncbi:Lhr family ATP dependent helicase [Isoptericola jiangsuensis]|uniref:Lhr family ATP dependent helicase n=1 Tax=Isoptericola jiangsuensis TaxID=548579 RepID=A0A2A9EUT9_9MICO|nr:ATP-dependent helicase [Isoptericola jiangsuensis]PFG42804.1 Lhr family ATP dependent helicase [Isoptericola jiangsuensis]